MLRNNHMNIAWDIVKNIFQTYYACKKKFVLSNLDFYIKSSKHQGVI